MVVRDDASERDDANIVPYGFARCRESGVMCA